MAENSLRERIILSDIALCETLVPSTIKTVIRTLPSYKEMQQFAVTQFPILAVVGRIPVPKNKINSSTGQVDQCISELKVDAYCYLLDNVSPDSMISSLMDDLFRTLYTNPTRSNLVMLTTLTLQEKIGRWTPYAAFQITCVHTYKHGIGGI